MVSESNSPFYYSIILIHVIITIVNIISLVVNVQRVYVK